MNYMRRTSLNSINSSHTVGLFYFLDISFMFLSKRITSEARISTRCTLEFLNTTQRARYPFL